MECFYNIKVILTFGGILVVSVQFNQTSILWLSVQLYRVFKSTADTENVVAADLTLQLLIQLSHRKIFEIKPFDI